MRAIRIIIAMGLEIGARHITISTAGSRRQISQTRLEPTQFSASPISLPRRVDEVGARSCR